MNGGLKRLVTPRTRDRRSRTPPSQPEERPSLKFGEIDIIELESAELEDATVTTKESQQQAEVKSAKPLKKLTTDLLEDDFRVVHLYPDQEMVCIP